MNVNYPDDKLADLKFPPDMLNHTYVGRCPLDPEDQPNGCSAPGAIFTDVNIWSRAMSEQEMKDWTACKEVSEVQYRRLLGVFSSSEASTGDAEEFFL